MPLTPPPACNRSYCVPGVNVPVIPTFNVEVALSVAAPEALTLPDVAGITLYSKAPDFPTLTLPALTVAPLLSVNKPVLVGPTTRLPVTFRVPLPVAASTETLPESRVRLQALATVSDWKIWAVPPLLICALTDDVGHPLPQFPHVNQLPVPSVHVVVRIHPTCADADELKSAKAATATRSAFFFVSFCASCEMNFFFMSSCC